eukprot:IDg10607t1
MLRACARFLLIYSGWAVTLQRVGARESADDISAQYTERESDTFVKDAPGDCFAVALMNVVFALRGQIAAKAVNAVVLRELRLRRDLSS